MPHLSIPSLPQQNCCIPFLLSSTYPALHDEDNDGEITHSSVVIGVNAVCKKKSLSCTIIKTQTCLTTWIRMCWFTHTLTKHGLKQTVLLPRWSVILCLLWSVWCKGRRTVVEIIAWIQYNIHFICIHIQTHKYQARYKSSLRCSSSPSSS